MSPDLDDVTADPVAEGHAKASDLGEVAPVPGMEHAHAATTPGWGKPPGLDGASGEHVSGLPHPGLRGLCGCAPYRGPTSRTILGFSV